MPRRQNDQSSFRGAAKREPGISRFRVWSFGSSRNDPIHRMTFMKSHFTGLAVATLLVIGSILPGYAEDTAAPKAPAPPPPNPTPAGNHTQQPTAERAR